MTELPEDFISTKGSQLKKDPTNDFQVVQFKRRISKKRKHEETEEKTEDVEQQSRPEINLKRARFEIMKFGMSGFEAKKKEEAKVQLAIKLGAKPPKKKYTNYKELLEEKKKQIKFEKRMTDLQQIGKNQMGKSTAKGKSYDRKRRKEQGLLDIYGKVKPIKNIKK